jgi:hypothetical protein
MNLPQVRKATRTTVLFEGESYLVIAAQTTRGVNYSGVLEWDDEERTQEAAPRLQESDFEVYRMDADGYQPFVAWLGQTSQAFRLAYVRAFFAFNSTYKRRKVLTANEIPQPFVFAYAC